MPIGNQMKKGPIYECEYCGLQLQVVAERTRCSVSSDCGCPSSFVCREKELALKK